MQDVANIANTISGAYAGNQLASNTTQKKISFFQLPTRPSMLPLRWVRSCSVCLCAVWLCFTTKVLHKLPRGTYSADGKIKASHKLRKKKCNHETLTPPRRVWLGMRMEGVYCVCVRTCTWSHIVLLSCFVAFYFIIKKNFLRKHDNFCEWWVGLRVTALAWLISGAMYIFWINNYHACRRRHCWSSRVNDFLFKMEFLLLSRRAAIAIALHKISVTHHTL